MKKFKFLTKNSVLRKIKTKGFIISQIITTILIIGISIVPSLLPVPKEEELVEYNVLVLNESKDDVLVNNYLKEEFSLSGNLVITNTENLDVDAFWNDDNYDVFIHYKSPLETKVDLVLVEDVDYYSKITTRQNDILIRVVNSTKYLLVNLEDYELKLHQKSEIIPGEPTEPVDPEDKPAVDGSVIAISTAYFAVVFMFIILSTQTLGAEILEEKSTKAIETIISSVPAEKHFYSKIVSSVIFTSISLSIMLVAGLVGFSISKIITKFRGLTNSEGFGIDLSSINNLVPILIITIIAALLGLLLYLIVFAFLASFANNNEEYQKAQTPLMLILIIAFYGSMILAGAQQFGIIKWLTYFPFFTPFLLPISMLAGEIAIWQGILIIGILVASAYFLTKLILPAYRVSILNYSNDKLFKNIKKSFKSSRNNKK